MRTRTVVLMALSLLAGGMVSSSLAAQAARVTGPATVSGRIVADSGKTPIVGAELVLTSVGVTSRSDSTGTFTFRALPTGNHRMIARAVGYQTVTISLYVGSDGVDDVDLALTRTATQLDAIDVKASGGLRAFALNGFEDRRKLGNGRFLDSTALLVDGDPKRWASVVIEKMPGLRLIPYSGRRSFASSRGTISFDNSARGDAMDRSQGAPKACYVQVIIDGNPRYGARMNEALLDVDGLDGPFIAAEYYTVAQTPPQFNRGGNAPCGTLALWTGR